MALECTDKQMIEMLDEHLTPQMGGSFNRPSGPIARRTLAQG